MAGIALIFTAFYLGVARPYLQAKTIAINKSVIKQTTDPETFYNLVADTFEPKYAVDNREALLEVLTHFYTILMGTEDVPTVNFIATVLEEQVEPLLEDEGEKRFTHNVAQTGILYMRAYEKTKNEAYFEKSEHYLKEAIEHTPNYPYALYSLAALYYKHGDEAKHEELVSHLLSIWPEDEKTSITPEGATTTFQ
jgi:tetratricopeptide (TPR) repeat protein